MNGWNAFRTGLSRALRYRWLLAILFAVNLGSALLLAALPALNLATWLGHQPTIRQAAGGVDAWLVIETLLGPVVAQALGSNPASGAQYLGLETLLVLAALPLVAWLPATFLTGGVLLTYAEAPLPFCWRRFLWGCWRWFGAFLLWSVVQAVVCVVSVSAALAAWAAGAAVGRWLAWVLVSPLALLTAAWFVLVELTRIAAVAGGTRNVFRAFGQAVRFAFRHPLQTSLLYALGLLLLMAVHALSRWGLLPRLPLAWWLLVLIAQQAFVLIRLAARLARLAGGMALLQKAVVLDFERQP